MIAGGLGRDLRFAWRSLLRRPAMTAVAVGTLALGIGLDVTIITMLNPMLIRPLPFAEPGRLVGVFGTREGLGTWASSSVGDVLDWRAQSRSFAALAAYDRTSMNLGGEATPERIAGARVTPELWSLLGIRPLLGRDLGPADAEPGAPAVIQISHALWQRAFSADPGIVGRTILIDDAPATIIGVLPRRIGFPEFAQAWQPLALPRDARNRGDHWLGVVGRLLEGVTIEQAQGEMDAIAAGLAARFPETNADWGVRLRPYRDQLIPPEVRRALLLFAVGALLVLLIACANAANVLLVRGAERANELAVRTALGAGRWRLGRLVLAESALLAAAGGVLGGVLGRYGITVALAAVPVDIPYYFTFEIDRYAAAMWLAVTILAALAVGIGPALQLSRSGGVPSLAGAGRGTAGGRARTRLRRALVVGELAMAAVLLASAALMARSFVNVSRADLGFATERVVHGRVTLAGLRFGDRERRVAFVRDAVAALAWSGGVARAAATSMPPISSYGWSSSAFDVEGRASEPGRRPEATYAAVTPEYFETMGIPITAGRAPDAREAYEAGGVVLVGETLAAAIWPDAQALGKRIRFSDGSPWLTVIGVVGDVRQPFDLTGTDDRPRWQLYGVYRDRPGVSLSLVARTAGDPAGLLGAVRAAVAAAAPGLPAYDVMTMEQGRAKVSWLAAYWSQLAGAYALLALLLAVAGVYGVVAFAVTLRTREIGVRLAVGATRRQVAALVAREGLTLVAAGAALGLAGALLVGRALARLLFGVLPHDPVALGGTLLVLGGAALAACILPARRAMSVDPATTLRFE